MCASDHCWWLLFYAYEYFLSIISFANDLRGLKIYRDVGDSTEISVSVRAPVTVTASEVIPGFPITTTTGTMSRSAEGFVTISELVQGVTTSRITSSTLAVPPGFALAYGYSNISYTRPRELFHLPDPIFLLMRLSRLPGETKEEHARPNALDTQPSEAHREPCFQDTIRRGQGKLHRGRDFSPLIPPAARHSTFNSFNVDRLGLWEERVPNEMPQIGRRWEMTWAAVKEYRLPLPPDNSFLPEFAYRAETTPATHKRTPVSAVTETISPLRNSGGPGIESRNIEDRENRNNSKFMNNGCPTRFAKDGLRKSEEPGGPRNFKGTRVDLKVGGG